MSKEKRVVVVTGKEVILFTDKDLEVIDKSSHEGLGKLIIRKKGEQEPLAVFKSWKYWRALTKDEKVDLTQIKKIIVRPEKPFPPAQMKSFFEMLERSQVVPIPHHWKIIILYKNGETKVI